MTSQATENNQKLFHHYGKKFATNDPLTYTHYADKLSLWLSDFKAYYAAARPQIVKLLLIAQVTLRKALGLAEHLNSPFNISEYSEHPMVNSYIRLVKTVEPFETYFTEPGLLAHIKSLVALVSPYATGSNQPITQPSSFQSDVQTHRHSSETLTLPTSDVSQTYPPTTNTELSSNTMIISPNILPVVAKAQIKAKKRKAVDFDLLVQRDIKALLEKEGNQGDSSQPFSEESMTSLHSLAAPPLSEKASSIVEFQDISAQDALEDEKIAAPVPIADFSPSQYMTVTAEAQGTSLPAHGEKMAGPNQNTLSCQDLSVATDPQRPYSPMCEDGKIASPDQIMEPLASRDLGAEPRLPVCEDQKMTGPDQITEPLPNLSGTQSPVCEDQGMAGPDQITEPLLSQDTSAAAEPQGTLPTCEDWIMFAPDQSTKPLPSQDTSSAVKLRGTSFACKDRIVAECDQTTEAIPSQDGSAPHGGGQIMADRDQIMEPTTAATESLVTSSHIVTENREMIPPGLVAEPLNLQQPIEDRQYPSQSVTQDEEMETGDPIKEPSLDAGVATEPLPLHKTSSSIGTQGSTATSINEESVTTSIQSYPQSEVKNITPLVSGDHVEKISSPVVDVRPPDNLVIGSPRSTMPGKFGQEMRIVACRKGLRKECTMSFTCTVSSVLLPKVSAWLNRNIFSLNIEESLCLSLGCYSIVDLQEESAQNNCTTLEQKTSVARSHWPQRGGLSMNVQFKNGPEDVPLSPPFQVTPDGLVDLSQFLFAGKNTIKLKQTTDMSQYVFVLHSHNPTRAQLQEVDRRRQRDKEWQEWACHVSMSFDIPSKLTLQKLQT